MKYFFSFLFTVFYVASCLAQKPASHNPSDIYESVKKINFLGSVLYIAAHPDDENTRLISYFSNQVKARTGYLSMTRGDGGQNLIGPEIRELLGVIRTQELLAARRTDGGEQFFTRANDFGYSKHPDETLVIWDKEAVLKDVVTRIRQFKPDIIINRFDHRTPGTTHGHHTSSAILSVEAFDLASNQNYKTHLEGTDLWQPKRLFFNTSWWFYGSEKKFAEADKSKMLNFDIGVYYPAKGLSNNEVAALASSQHLSQGFGRLSTRGSQVEYIELLKGDLPSNKEDIFDGIDTSWNRVKGGAAVGTLLKAVEEDFNFKDPSTHLPALVTAYQLLQQIEDEHWKAIKTKELKSIIEACAGLYLEASAENSKITGNEEVKLSLEAINRSETKILLKSIQLSNETTPSVKNIPLTNNLKVTFNDALMIPLSQLKYTTPYWLEHKGSLGMYAVDNEALIGLPETPTGVTVDFNLDIEGVPIQFVKPVIHRYSKPDKGELYQPFEIVPEVSVKMDSKILVSKPKEPISINVTVKAMRDNISGTLGFDMPKTWTSKPQNTQIDLLKKGEEKTIPFVLNSTNGETIAYLKAAFKINNVVYDDEVVEINYDHIPTQTVLVPAETKVVRLNIQKKGEHIGYIQGAGDNIPSSLRQIGYRVTELNGADITAEGLQQFDAVILGLRTYNIDDDAKFYQNKLHEYVKQGGNLLVQYNTSRRQKVTQVAPYPLKLSRDRVTDESSEVRFIDPNHEVLNYPNKITQEDFQGWVQERGLYFPNEWDKAFTPILSMNDQGESPKNGSLLVAKYGKGYFIYTGLSFFRELPAGVPGAYRLFTNLVSVGKNNSQTQIKN